MVSYDPVRAAASSLDIGVRYLMVSLCEPEEWKACLENLLAGEQVPLLTDLSFDKVIESLDAKEVDKGVSDLVYQLGREDPAFDSLHYSNW